MASSSSLARSAFRSASTYAKIFAGTSGAASYSCRVAAISASSVSSPWCARSESCSSFCLSASSRDSRKSSRLLVPAARDRQPPGQVPQLVPQRLVRRACARPGSRASSPPAPGARSPTRASSARPPSPPPPRAPSRNAANRALLGFLSRRSDSNTTGAIHLHVSRNPPFVAFRSSTLGIPAVLRVHRQQVLRVQHRLLRILGADRSSSSRPRTRASFRRPAAAGSPASAAACAPPRRPRASRPAR